MIFPTESSIERVRVTYVIVKCILINIHPNLNPNVFPNQRPILRARRHFFPPNGRNASG